VGIKLNFSSPAHLAIAGSAGLATWAATGYSTDPKHLVAVATASLAGVSSHTASSSSPNVQSDSHIVTPYVNNIEE